jgi:MFS family permease
VAFGLLALAPLAFESLFLVSFCVAMVGLGVLVLFVQNPPLAQDVPAPSPPSLRDAGRLLELPGFRVLLVIGSTLGLATLSDAFLYLALEQRADFSPSAFPLLFVGTAAVYMLLAIPAGRLADRVGRGRVFVAGYGLLALVYGVLLLSPAAWPMLPAILVLLGAYYAATDGVLMAMGSSLCPPELRGTGLAMLGTATSIARLLASVLFGALWVIVGMETAIAAFAGVLALTLAFAATTLARKEAPASA